MSAKTTYSTNNIQIVLHFIHCVVLHRRCQIITQISVNFWCSFWKKLHWTEKIYTGTAPGARDKYEVCADADVNSDADADDNAADNDNAEADDHLVVHWLCSCHLLAG